MSPAYICVFDARFDVGIILACSAHLVDSSAILVRVECVVRCCFDVLADAWVIAGKLYTRRCVDFCRHIWRHSSRPRQQTTVVRYDDSLTLPPQPRYFVSRS